jgi:hypothetical protein
MLCRPAIEHANMAEIDRNLNKTDIKSKHSAEFMVSQYILYLLQDKK